MLSAFQKQKMIDWFHVMDENRDGVLELQDLMRHVQLLQKEKNWPEDHPGLLRIIAAKQKTWVELQKRVDLNKDDRLDKGEWLAFFEKVIDELKQTGELPAWVLEAHVATFESMDLSGDGKISPAEYDSYLRSLQIEGGGKEAFRRADLDGNGYITIEEMRTLLGELLLSDDVDARGNSFMIGKIYG